MNTTVNSFANLLTRICVAFLIVLSFKPQPAIAENIERYKCVTDKFHEIVDVERFFKGFVYDGMLAQCQMSEQNNHYVRSYIKSYAGGYKNHISSIVEECNVSRVELAGITLAYARGMRVSGGISLWRLIDNKDKAATCSAILLIVKNKSE
jgi:hypothetical protein